MKGTTRLPALVSLMAFAFAALAQTATSQTKDERAVRAASDSWQRYIAAQQVDSIVALHTPDAVVLFGNAPAMKGSAAIRSNWTDVVKIPAYKVNWTPITIDVASPTRATEYGSYTESYDTPTGKTSDAGNYVTVWHKVNGKWLVAVDAPVSSTPLPALSAAAAPPMDPGTMEMAPASALKWGDVTVPGFAPGAKIAVLHGNPSGPGGFVLRLQFPDGYQIPVHWHPTGENVTVVSGSVALGMGNTFDASALHTYGVGDFVYLPPVQSHYGQAHGATIVQINGRGPFVINPGTPK
ncbi:MAG TPA: nuclear transport factor 2 family protein [Gemmatimonadaceae bacterium]|jgi:ketosteroid isomerase-like protein/quercetin dioxygenase-like cupin family protein|nr:nuclear transport factor 2 family protein [Gemmatimonadaceae bacterium]